MQPTLDQMLKLARVQADLTRLLEKMGEVEPKLKGLVAVATGKLANGNTIGNVKQYDGSLFFFNTNNLNDFSPNLLRPDDLFEMMKSVFSRVAEGCNFHV